MKKRASAAVWAVAVCVALSQVTAQYGPPPSSGKKQRTTTTTTESPSAISNEIPGPGFGQTSGNFWWSGPDSPFKPGPHATPTNGACTGPAGCLPVGTDPGPSPTEPPGKPIDIAQNPFLSSAILGKPISQSPQGCNGFSGSCQSPTQYPGTSASPTPFPGQSTQYPSSPGEHVGKYPAQSQYPGQQQPTSPSQHPGQLQPTGSNQYHSIPQPIGSNQYPGQPQTIDSNQYPGQQQPSFPSQYPNKPQPATPSQYPGHPQSAAPSQYPGQPQPAAPSQYPGQPQPAAPSQYPGQPQPAAPSQYPGQPQPAAPSQYPGQPQPAAPSQYPGQPQPAVPSQYPGQPQPAAPSQFPGQPQPAAPSQFPGQPQPAAPSQYPGQPQPAAPSQYPGQPQPAAPSQYPGQPQPAVPSQYPGQPQLAAPSQYPGQPQTAAPNVPLRPLCSLAGHACVPSSTCVNGVVTLNGMRQMRDPQVKECIPGLEACCKVPTPGSSPGTQRPEYGVVTQRPYTGPLNVTPYPGCASALKCVAENYCTAEGVMSDSPVVLTRDQAENKVPLSDCQDLETGIIGKCCRDPNYTDPWPGGMMMMKTPGNFDDGQYHGEASGPGSNVGPFFNTISPTPHSPAKDHGPKTSDIPGGFSKPLPPPYPGTDRNSATNAPGRPSAFSPTAPSYPNNQPGPPKSPYQPSLPSGTLNSPSQPSYQPGQPSRTPDHRGQPSSSEPFQPGQPTGTPFQPGQPSVTSDYQGETSPSEPFQPGQPTETLFQPGQPSSRPSGTPYQPGKPNPSEPFPNQPNRPPVNPYQPSIPSEPTYRPNQPSSSPFVPPEQPYRPGQPVSIGSTNQPGQQVPEEIPLPDFPKQQTEYNLPTHPGQNKPAEPSEPADQASPSCGFRSQGPGGDVAGFGEISWQALVVSAGNRSLLCGAAIIANNAVVTAAHCVNQLKAQDLLVKSGEWGLLGQNPKPVQVRPVAAIARHPAYDSGSLAKDLAILVIAETFTFDVHVNKICIPQDIGSEYFQKPGQKCLISGWGKNALQGPVVDSELHIVDVTVVPAKQCESKLKTSQNLGKYFILNEGFSCALPPSPTDLCKVDFGSAVACDRGDGLYELAGVNSWDIACQSKQPLPSVFATSDAQWINIVLGTPLPVLQAQEDSFNQGLLKGERLDGVDTEDKPGFSQGYGK